MKKIDPLARGPKNQIIGVFKPPNNSETFVNEIYNTTS